MAWGGTRLVVDGGAENLSTIRDGSVDTERWQAAWNQRFQKIVLFNI